MKKKSMNKQMVLLELNREVYSLKKKFKELEGTTVYKRTISWTNLRRSSAAKAAEVRVAENQNQ